MEELPDALHPNNLPVGYTKMVTLPEDQYVPPTVGERFYLGWFCTSGVRELLPDNKFRTYSSIYQVTTETNEE